jgi:hypothetical protein
VGRRMKGRGKNKPSFGRGKTSCIILVETRRGLTTQISTSRVVCSINRLSNAVASTTRVCACRVQWYSEPINKVGMELDRSIGVYWDHFIRLYMYIGAA